MAMEFGVMTHFNPLQLSRDKISIFFKNSKMASSNYNIADKLQAAVNGPPTQGAD